MDSVLKAMDLEGTEIRGRLIKVMPRQGTGIFDSAPRHDAQYNDIQRNGLIDTQHNDIQRNDLIFDTQHNDIQRNGPIYDTELNSIECLCASVCILWLG